MKVLIIGCFDLLMHPYSRKYIEILEMYHVDYDMIYWNRSSDDNHEKHYCPFQFPLNTYSSRLKKIKGYYKYRQFVLGYIKSGEYDKIIFLTTQTMVYFFNFALGKYKNKYIFDYRDETYESNKLFKNIVLICIKNSHKVVMSSPGFIKLFDKYIKDKFVLCHNTKNNFCNISIKKTPSTKIRITYWGQIRLPEYFIKIIKAFENDTRFELNFHGEGNSEPLIQFVKRNKINNVFFSGRFTQGDITKFASETDFLINCYPNDSYQKLALTVKMYEGISFGIPMLVQKGSFMSEYLKKYGYPFVEVDFDGSDNHNSLKNSILDFDNINIDKNSIISEINRDQNLFNSEIVKFIQGDSE